MNLYKYFFLPFLLAELNKVSKKLLSDMKNLFYHCSGKVETLTKKLEDTDKQLRECL
jgi:hypothetical protein